MQINKMSTLNKSIHKHNLRYVKKLQEESGMELEYICKELSDRFILRCGYLTLIAVDDNKLVLMQLNNEADKDGNKLQKFSDEILIKELENKENNFYVYERVLNFLYSRSLSKVKCKQLPKLQNTLII